MSRLASAALAAVVLVLGAAPSRAALGEQCSWPPPGGPAIHPESRQVEMAPVVADLDADGLPEIVVVSFADGNDDGAGHDGILRILRGTDCSEIATTADVGCVTCFGDATCRSLDESDQAGFLCPACGVAVADLDDDGFMEIVGVSEGGPLDFGDRRMVVFDRFGQFVRCTASSPERIGSVAAPVIADLDADGTPELVARASAWSSLGPLLWAQPATGIGMTTAADLDDDGVLEVITGEAAYRADGTVLWHRDDLTIGSPAVADLDLDCVPEVVISSRNAQSVHVVDGLTGVTRASAPIPPGDCPPRVDGQGGPPTLADTDGDCVPEIGVAGCRRYALYKWLDGPPEQLVELWESPTDDSSSRFTGSAIFDLEGDGTAEVLYNDHTTFRIYDAVTGAIEQQLPNSTFTLIEFPVVADADADGLAEVVLSANDYVFPGHAGVRVLSDAAVPWAPASNLFNQHSYHVTNILPDGRVPAPEEPSWARYNSFRVQGPAIRSVEGPELHGVPPDQQAPCDAIPPPASPTATGGCGDVPVVTFAQEAAGGACGELHRTWTATDRCGRQTSATQVIDVVDAVPPVLRGVPISFTLPCPQPVPPPVNVTATDNCDPAPVVAFGETSTSPCPGEITVTRTWTATDACGNQATATQVIRVVDDRPPYLINVPADQTLSCHVTPVDQPPTAADDCDPSPVITMTETDTPGSCAGSHVLRRTWTATDDCGNTAQAVQVITFIDDTPPRIVGVPPGGTFECDAVPPRPNPTAVDTCDPGATISLSETETPGRCAAERAIRRVWTARDACGNVATVTQVVTVVDTTAPALTGVPADVTVACDAVPPPASPTATDNCGPPPPVTYAQARVDGACGGSYQLHRTWTATDACGNAASREQVITVTDTSAPSLTGVPADVTVTCSAVPPAASPVASDACDPAPAVAFSELRIDGACPDAYQLERTWTATDWCGNSVVRVQRVTVTDDGPPVLSGVPGDVTVECGTPLPPASVTATDGCDPAPVITMTETRIDGRCAGEYDVVRQWTAVDRCGGTATARQVVHVVDTTPPVISGFEARCIWSPNHWTACLSPGDFHPAVEDACGGPVTWSFAGCASDQPEDALGDGAFAPDCSVDAEGRLCVRSERQGMIPEGRHYGVMIVAVDACGNASAPTLIGDVWIPRDQREHPDCLKIQDVGEKGPGRP